VVLGAALATSAGVIGGSMQIAMHAMGKITLFFCAGAIYTATRKTEVSQMAGLGRVMPFTFGAFLIGALSIIGLPPMGGAWSKWYLMLGAADTDQLVLIAVLMISSLLNVAYLIPIVARGFFLPANEPQPASASAAAAPAPKGVPRGIREAPWFCVVPLCLTALGCVALFFFADPLYRLLEPIAPP
jgi:multicomponent Na+:H+ antiporter subunit D